MAEQKPGSVQSNSAGGIGGAHAEFPEHPAFVAPGDAEEKNTVRAGLFPIACWRLDDPRFDFDSSIVLPQAAEEMSELAVLTLEHPGAPLSMFGHADPVGDDDYNKQLGGRRVTAVYAMLLRDTAAWEQLYSQPLGKDDWHNRIVPLIRDELELTGTGDGNAASRAQLFRDYMDHICRFPGSEDVPAGQRAQPFQLTKADFLARGADAGGKGDVQSCGEFNPVLMFSKDENQAFAEAEDKTKRNKENEPNRRVVTLLFRPGSQIVADRWPCPRVKEGTAGCRARFWSDAAKRRSFQDVRRLNEKTHDTFACRFYDRLNAESPCERSVANTVLIRLLYEDETPMANAEFTAVFGEVRVTGKTDEQGRAAIEPPEDADEVFELFLGAFPERYIRTEANAPTEAGSTAVSSSGAKLYWPEGLAALFVMLFLAARLSAADLPVDVTLRGPLYSDTHPAQMELALTTGPSGLAGTVKYGDWDVLTLTGATLTVLDRSDGPTGVTRYRLRYSVNQCEHAKAADPKAAVTRWDWCRYTDGQRVPVRLMAAEVLLTRERTQEGEVFTAAGVPDVHKLWGVFRLSGKVVR